MVEEALLPGLPDEIARECLVRIPYTGFPTVKSVCKLWRQEMESSDFHSFRKSGGFAHTVVAMTQSDPSPFIAPSNSEKQTCSYRAPNMTPVYRLTLYELATGACSTLPAIPGFAHGLPLFCQITSAGRSIVVVGGWDPETWAASDQVYVFNFVCGRWSSGKPMPGPRRSFFACASDSNRTMFVAGGHDEEKNAMRSALAYDVEEDRWVHLPDMIEERDECKGIFCDGMFRVIGGYSTEFQGRFGKSMESFDSVTGEWGPIEEETLEVGTCPRTTTCYMGGNHAMTTTVRRRKLYRCREGKLEVKDWEETGSLWTVVVDFPDEVKVAPCLVAVNEGSLFVVGSECHGGVHQGYVLDVENKRWSKVDLPEEFSGHVQTAYSLYI